MNGHITDTEQLAVFGATILAVPLNKDLKTQFTSTDLEGNYSFSIEKNEPYDLSITHISYQVYKATLQADKHLHDYDFVMKPALNALEEIILTERIPIVVKQDTTVFRADAFSNGRERKLRELLKKFPGMTVDRDGNVEFNGKRITQLLVDGKQFFNGDTKMGVNNIPAGVADEVEVIEDYHETAFLKGLESSQDIAMNIKLKEDAKGFFFGDIEVGGGIENRYVVHPALFKYGDKSTFNVIADANNTVTKSFTARDYIKLKASDDLDNIGELASGSIYQNLTDRDYISNEHRFAAINSQYNPTEKSEFRGFIIGLNDNNRYENSTVLDFLQENIVDNQNRNMESDQSIFVSNLSYKYLPDENTEFKSQITTELSQQDQETNIRSTFLNNSLPFEQFNTGNDVNAFISTWFSKKFNKNHVMKSKFTLGYTDNESGFSTSSSSNIYSNGLPVIGSNRYDILQQSNSQNFQLKLDADYYWVVNRKNHIYFKTSYVSQHLNFKSQVKQDLETGSLYSFDDFRNDLDHIHNNLITGVTYKRILGDFIVSLNAGYRNDFLKVKNPSSRRRKVFHNVVPSAIIEWQINKRNKLQANYERNYLMPQSLSFALGNRLQGYSSIISGNDDLEIQGSNVVSLSYNYNKTYGLGFSIFASYRDLSHVAVNSFIVDSVYRTTIPIQLDQGNNSFNIKWKTSYIKPYWNLRFISSYRNSTSVGLINLLKVFTVRNVIDNALSFKTVFKKKPNLDVTFAQIYYNNRIDGLENRQNNLSLDIGTYYNYNSWDFEIDYTFTSFSSSGATNSDTIFDNLSTSVKYHAEDSLWTFDLSLYNLTGNQVNARTSFNTTLVVDYRTAVFPRYAQISIIRKI